MKHKWYMIFLCVLLLYSNILVVSATGGSGNLDGGGSGLNSGDSQNYWSNGNEGVRVTVINTISNKIVATPIDISNSEPSSSIYHFGKISKLQYSDGNGLNPMQGGYAVIKPPLQLPKIISSNSGSNNIEEIKRYFTSEYLIKLVANHTGMDYDILINGDYKLLIEPIAYFKFQGVMIATTATEAAMYDELINGLLRSHMVSLSHKNLPLAMFLEVSDLGYPAWSGSKTTPATNYDIKTSLGLGIVKFTEKIEESGTGKEYDYIYRTNTEVITSVYVRGGTSTPHYASQVSFSIQGTTYHVGNVYYPKDEGQLAWVRWTTPSTPQEIRIPVSVSGPGEADKEEILVLVVGLDENPPPNPVADDRNDGFQLSQVPSRTETTRLEWTIWEPWWKSKWEWEQRWVQEPSSCTVECEEECEIEHRVWVDRGQWVDHGEWNFTLRWHYAKLETTMKLIQDVHNPTATQDTLKSGYGVGQEVATKVVTSQNQSVSRTPNGMSYFPEFQYQTYWRVLERMSNGLEASFLFKENVYSTFQNRIHFTPIWFPDGNYRVNTRMFDVWTPSGMLSQNVSDSLNIQGNLWDDWHIAPIEP